MQVKHERPDWVKSFDRPVGTEIKHIKGHWYLYEVSSHYDPVTKRSRKKSGRCLGKITPDGFVPSRRRAEEARPLDGDLEAVAARLEELERTCAELAAEVRLIAARGDG